MRQMALAMDFQKDSTAELEKSRNKIIRISERAMRQVNDLTKIARLEEGLFTLEPVSIRAVCDDVLSELEQLFALNQRKLRFEYRNKARLVIGNYDLIFSGDISDGEILDDDFLGCWLIFLLIKHRQNRLVWDR